MSNSAAALKAEFSPSFALHDMEMSGEFSRLILDAMNCVNQDENIAINLIRKASTLLRPVYAGPAGETKGRPSGGLAPWQINRVKEFIERHLAEPIMLDDLARIAKLSTSYFSTAFKASFGTSPHSYILEQRVEHAKHRMINTEAPLSEIALDCGLADQAHLSRLFRRATGSTPSAWRRFRRSAGVHATAA